MKAAFVSLVAVCFLSRVEPGPKGTFTQEGGTMKRVAREGHSHACRAAWTAFGYIGGVSFAPPNADSTYSEPEAVLSFDKTAVYLAPDRQAAWIHAEGSQINQVESVLGTPISEAVGTSYSSNEMDGFNTYVAIPPAQGECSCDGSTFAEYELIDPRDLPCVIAGEPNLGMRMSPLVHGFEVETGAFADVAGPGINSFKARLRGTWGTQRIDVDINVNQPGGRPFVLVQTINEDNFDFSIFVEEQRVNEFFGFPASAMTDCRGQAGPPRLAIGIEGDWQYSSAEYHYTVVRAAGPPPPP